MFFLAKSFRKFFFFESLAVMWVTFILVLINFVFIFKECVFSWKIIYKQLFRAPLQFFFAVLHLISWKSIKKWSQISFGIGNDMIAFFFIDNHFFCYFYVCQGLPFKQLYKNTYFLLPLSFFFVISNFLLIKWNFLLIVTDFSGMCKKIFMHFFNFFNLYILSV